MDLPSFTISKKPILQGLLILSIFLSGYFIYLLKIEIFGYVPGEIRNFFDILSFGIAIIGFIFLITGSFSVIKKGQFVNKNKYLGYVLHVTIGFSALCILFYNVNADFFLKSLFLINSLLIDFFIFIFWIFVLSVFYYIAYKEFFSKNVKKRRKRRR